MFIAIFPLEFVAVTNAMLTEWRWNVRKKETTTTQNEHIQKRREYIPECNGGIETCRVFGNPKCFPFHYDKMRDNEPNGGKMEFFFPNIDSCNEWQKAELKMRVHSLHGLLKQKFIRFMHSCGQFYTNE